MALVRRSLLVFVFVSAILGVATAQNVAATSAPASRPASRSVEVIPRLERDVRALSSDAFEGRGAPARERVTAWLSEHFEAAGLEMIGESWLHPFRRGGRDGVNVAGILRGRDTALATRHLIVSAHWDHLGKLGQTVFPGAADNASGVAAMLALAERLARAPERPARSVVFVAFDLEEVGLHGSFAWAEQPPVALDRCDHFITMDILGKNALGLVPDWLFAVGWEWTPEVLPMLDEAAAEAGLTMAYFGSDVVGDRSDFVAFKRRRIPHLFFSTGENEDYHRPTDTADRVDYTLLSKHVTALEAVVRHLAERPEAYVSRAEADMNLAEMRSFRDLIRRITRTRDPRLGFELRQQAALLAGWANGVLQRGKVEAVDRKILIEAVRKVQFGLH